MAWRRTATIARLLPMDVVPRPDDDTPDPRLEAERQRRIAWEAEGIARARPSIAAGYYATAAEVDAWMDSLGSPPFLSICPTP